MDLILSLTLCVLSSVAFATENRIVGGRPANVGEFPFMVSIRRSYNDKHTCGGSIITSKHVVTAAHCMFYTWGGVLPHYVISVVVGQLNLPITSTSVYRNASTIFVHPKYNSKTMENDIAVIEVDTPFPMDNALIGAVTVRNESLKSGTCFVTGWGVQEFNSSVISDALLTAQVNLVDVRTCSEMYGIDFAAMNGTLCAGHEEGKTDACQGDSGGPLLCDGLQTGIVSTGSGCADPDFPGIYTDVAAYTSWLREVATYVECRQEAPSVDKYDVASTIGATFLIDDDSSENNGAVKINKFTVINFYLVVLYVIQFACLLIKQLTLR